MLIQGTVCPTLWGNTGGAVNGCAFSLEQIESFIFLHKNKGYDMSTFANAAALYTQLRADCLADIPANRIFPFHRVADVTSNTGDVQTLESAHGYLEDTGLSQIRWTVNMNDYSLKNMANIHKFAKNPNLAVVPVFKGGVANSVPMFRKGYDGKDYGFEVMAYTSQPQPASGSTRQFQQFMLSFKDKDAFLSDMVEFVPLAAGHKLSQIIEGIHDVKLTLVSASTNAIVLTVTDAASGEVLGDLYEDELTQASAWLIPLVSTGVPVVPSSVTYNSTSKEFTLSGTYTTAAHKASLKGPTALAALETPFGNGTTGGFESNIIDVTPS